MIWSSGMVMWSWFMMLIRPWKMFDKSQLAKSWHLINGFVDGDGTSKPQKGDEQEWKWNIKLQPNLSEWVLIGD